MIFSLPERCFFPGDRIAIAPDRKIAKQPKILADFIAAVLEREITESDIVLLLTEQEFKEKEAAIRDAVSQKLSNSLGPSLRIVCHQPGNRREISFLGANRRGEPIGICRELADADFVIPICEKSGEYGIHTGLFPRFGDRETQMRFAEAESSGKMSSQLRKRLTDDVEEAANLLGVIFTVQIVKNSATENMKAGINATIVPEIIQVPQSH